jgi:hypothetical protein
MCSFPYHPEPTPSCIPFHSQILYNLCWSNGVQEKKAFNHLQSIPHVFLINFPRIWDLSTVSRTTSIRIQTFLSSQIPHITNAHHQQPKPTTIPPTLADLPTKPKPRHENIYNLPNILTFSRLIATPVIGYLIVHNQHLYAFTLFLYAGFSDLLDGWIARKWNLQTVVRTAPPHTLSKSPPHSTSPYPPLHPVELQENPLTPRPRSAQS